MYLQWLLICMITIILQENINVNTHTRTRTHWRLTRTYMRLLSDVCCREVRFNEHIVHTDVAQGYRSHLPTGGAKVNVRDDTEAVDSLQCGMFTVRDQLLPLSLVYQHCLFTVRDQLLALSALFVHS